MILKIFTVYDAKSEAYLTPFFALANGQAIRSFEDSANEVGHAFNKHASDFTLFVIGEYDDAHAKITPYSSIINLGLAAEFKNGDKK